MLAVLEKTEFVSPALASLLDLRQAENAYVVIDVQSYGLAGENVESWSVSTCGGGIACFVYRYYQTLHVVEGDSPDAESIRLVCGLIGRLQPEMISANARVIGALAAGLEGYRATYGYAMRPDGSQAACDGVSEASTEEYGQIAELICSNPTVGSHYSPEDLSGQLSERAALQGCRSFIVKSERGVESHMATYAESESLAVLGGLISREGSPPGSGSKVLSTIAADAINRGKAPILYCYVESLWPWYGKRGWRPVAEVGKLEKNACGG